MSGLQFGKKRRKNDKNELTFYDWKQFFANNNAIKQFPTKINYSAD